MHRLLASIILLAILTPTFAIYGTVGYFHKFNASFFSNTFLPDEHGWAVMLVNGNLLLGWEKFKAGPY